MTMSNIQTIQKNHQLTTLPYRNFR